MRDYHRKELPQIKNIKEFAKFLDKYHIPYSYRTVNIKDLDNLQRDFSQQKVDSIKNQINSGWYKSYPIVISYDGTIIDGHHRYQAYKELNIPLIKSMVIRIKPEKLLEIIP